MNRYPEAMKNDLSVAVIGAGLSGLACATELQQAGCKVQVFDKSRGPSGRLSTRRGDGWQCDHGAQYFTARDPRFQNELARWQAHGVAALWEPRLVVLGDEDKHRVETGLKRFVGTPRMSAPGRFLADALPLALQCTVNGLARTDQGWQISSVEQGGLPESFGALVLALPAPQAVPLLRTTAPAMAETASQARMRACWALMLRYDTPLALPFDAAFVNRGPVRWVARESSKPGRPSQDTWLLHASAEWSEEHVDAQPEDVAAVLLAAFAELGAPVPQAWTAHRWRYADTMPPLQLGCCWDNELQLGMCGDWLNGGKVQGAWLSGFELAGQMLRSL